MVKQYELLFMVVPTLDEQGQTTAVAEVAKAITEAGGAVMQQEDLGRKKLGYEIRHEKFAHYVLILFSAEGAALKKIESKIKLITEVMRCLMTERIERQVVARSYHRPAADKPAVAEPVHEKRTPAEEAKRQEESKIRLEDLDKKLDEILKEEV